MTGEKQRERLAEFTQRMSDTILKKGDDYAGQEDRLANFKDAGQITGTTAAQQCFNLMGTKMARLKQLLNSKETKLRVDRRHDFGLGQLLFSLVLLQGG